MYNITIYNIIEKNSLSMREPKVPSFSLLLHRSSPLAMILPRKGVVGENIGLSDGQVFPTLSRQC